jgi:uncharacterized protein YhhL (DUF1145 family)
MDLIGLIVFLVVAGLLFWVVRTLSGAFGIPAPIVTVIQVVLVVVIVLYLLQMLGLGGSLPALRLR